MRARVLGDRLFSSLVITAALAGLAIFASATLGLLARNTTSVLHDLFIQTGLGLGIGAIGFVIARSLPLATLRRYAFVGYIGTLIGTLLVFIPGIGIRAGGATRWIDVGPLTIQPAEFLKIGFIVALAAFLSSRARELKNPRRGLLAFGIFLTVPALILLAQPNTSTTILLVLTGCGMYFAAGAPLRDFGILALVGVLVIGTLFITRPYVRDRVLTFMHPETHSLGRSYQIQQSLIAIGSGGLVGRGFGQSVEKFNYLPEPEGDSIFAVFAEETGFIGALLLVLLFFTLAARGIVLAGQARDLFGGLLALGASSIIFVQAFVNIGAMLGMVPLTGLPLPLVSHGGTALLATLFLCGLVMNVAAHKTSA